MPSSFILDAWSFAGSQPVALLDPEHWQDNSWFHCLRDSPDIEAWLLAQDFNPALISAILAEDTRPRFQKLNNETFLLILRSVNSNEGEQPDNMLSLRVIFYKNSLFTFRKRPLKAIAAAREELQNGIGAISPSGMLLSIIEQLHKQIDLVLDDAEIQIESLQAEIDIVSQARQKELTLMHKQLLGLNRFLKPQTHALNELSTSRMAFLDDQEMSLHYFNQRDVIFRLVENIESFIEQVWMLREHVQQLHSDIMNRNTYRLSILAGIFLPIGFITGLLGVNVGGIPGADSPLAFAILCIILLGLGVIEFLVLRRMRFLG